MLIFFIDSMCQLLISLILEKGILEWRKISSSGTIVPKILNPF